MRILIYAPIIHMIGDLGSLADEVHKRGVANLGGEIWTEHLETIVGFWDALKRYFDSLDISGIKIYQDGMLADGEIGAKIVEEGIKSGSKNYDIISMLLKKGACLVKTEEFSLLKAERDRLLQIIQAKSLLKKIVVFTLYKFSKNSILNKRDEFIANRIIETLNEGETGILFIGASHNVKDKLPEDISVIEVKEMKRVKEYQRLLPYYHKHKARLKELSKYLVADVKNDGNR